MPKKSRILLDKNIKKRTREMIGDIFSPLRSVFVRELNSWAKNIRKKTMSILTARTTSGAVVKVNISDDLLARIGKGDVRARLEGDKLIEKIIESLKRQENN